MEIDESGWHDLNERLSSLPMTAEQRDTLIDHLSSQLVGHFGTDAIECHLGKDDPRRHAMREVAAAAVAHLAGVFGHLPPDTVTTLIESGDIGAPMPPPWDDHWRSQSRTASWRS